MRYTAIGLATLLLAGCGDGTGPEPQTWTRTFHVFGTVRSEVDSLPLAGVHVYAHELPSVPRIAAADDTTDRVGNYSLEFTRTYREDYCGFAGGGRGNADPSWVDFAVSVKPNDGMHAPAIWANYIPGVTVDAVVCGRRENRLDFYLRLLDQP